MSRWAYFSERPEAREHLFEDAPWYALNARTKCGIYVYTAALRPNGSGDPDEKRRPRCVNCIEIMISEEPLKCRI